MKNANQQQALNHHNDELGMAKENLRQSYVKAMKEDDNHHKSDTDDEPKTIEEAINQIAQAINATLNESTLTKEQSMLYWQLLNCLDSYKQSFYRYQHNPNDIKNLNQLLDTSIQLTQHSNDIMKNFSPSKNIVYIGMILALAVIPFFILGAMGILPAMPVLITCYSLSFASLGCSAFFNIDSTRPKVQHAQKIQEKINQLQCKFSFFYKPVELVAQTTMITQQSYPHNRVTANIANHGLYKSR